jgi:CYTH domain-containing protein
MAREIERKFLVNGDRWRTLVGAGVVFRQGYLSLEPERSVRVRLAGEIGSLNIKRKISMLSRHEFEYAISAKDAHELLDGLCIQPLIVKTRYRLTHGGLVWEIDEFAGDNDGLIIAEIELESEEQDFDTPEWLGEEVSHDPRYLNINLVKRPYSHWPDRIRR